MFSSTFSQLVIYFMIYSIVGWVCETITCSINKKQFVNRGFLTGPYCPIYGVGGLLVLFITETFRQNPLIIFILSVIIASTVEYITSWLLERLFNTKLWDYSNEKLHIKGRVCLRNAVIFGLMGVFLTYVAHPFISKFLDRIDPPTQRVFASIIIGVVLFDLLRTISDMLGLNERLKSLHIFFTELEQYQHKYQWFDKKDLHKSLERLRDICDEDTENDEVKLVLEKFERMLLKSDRTYRMTRAYPHMQTKELNEELQKLKESWKWHAVHPVQQIKETVRSAGHKTITAAKKMNPFAADISFYKMVWVFTIGSILGYVVETIFCFVTKGVIESRQGLLYGPFSQIYGLGAVIMVLFLTPFAKKSDRWLFFGSAFLGGVFEYLCSLFQEYVFGSVSWEYSSQKFSIGGRTSLLFMLFWGILGVVFMKGIYPKISELIKRITQTRGVILTWVIIVLLSADMLLSAAAVLRWRERTDGIPPHNTVEEYLDNRYPDGMMEEIYPNMKMIER